MSPENYSQNSIEGLKTQEITNIVQKAQHPNTRNIISLLIHAAGSKGGDR